MSKFLSINPESQIFALDASHSLDYAKILKKGQTKGKKY